MVKLRLARGGRKKLPIYRIVAADSRARRDGSFLEILGQYDPRFNPARVTLKEPRVMRWLNNGAQPTDTVRSLLSRQGIMLRWQLEKKGTDATVIDAEMQKWQTLQQLKIAREEARNAQRANAKKAKSQPVAQAVEPAAQPAESGS